MDNLKQYGAQEARHQEWREGQRKRGGREIGWEEEEERDRESEKERERETGKEGRGKGREGRREGEAEGWEYEII